jgi:hypothetical protein
VTGGPHPQAPNPEGGLSSAGSVRDDPRCSDASASTRSRRGAIDSSADSRSSARSTRSWTAEAVRTLALRGTWSSRDSSPTISPGPSQATTSPGRVTATSPSTISAASTPRSPCNMMSRSAARSCRSPNDARRRSSSSSSSPHHGCSASQATVWSRDPRRVIDVSTSPDAAGRTVAERRARVQQRRVGSGAVLGRIAACPAHAPPPRPTGRGHRPLPGGVVRPGGSRTSTVPGRCWSCRSSPGSGSPARPGPTCRCSRCGSSGTWRSPRPVAGCGRDGNHVSVRRCSCTARPACRSGSRCWSSNRGCCGGCPCTCRSCW